MTTLLQKRAAAKADEVFDALDAYSTQTPAMQKLTRATFMLGWQHGRAAGLTETMGLVERAMLEALQR